MLGKILPSNIFNAIDTRLNYNELNEIRLRAGQPVVVFISGRPYYLAETGVTTSLDKAITITKMDIENVIFNASGFSIYSVNEQIKKGFIIVEGGIRIGICGSVVCENEQIKTITDFSSLNIRIPHEVKNCCLPVFAQLVGEYNVRNTLILSPPGCGKTTFIRDFVYQLSERNYCLNVLILDERGEIFANGQMRVGKFADVLSFINKKEGFENGIRAMCPNLIVTDELGFDKDIEALKYAMNCGVSVVATVHASNIEELKNKQGFKDLLVNKYFSRYVILSSKQGPGTVEGVYNENLTRISSWG